MEKITVKKFLSDKIDALEKRMETIFELHKVALEKSESQMILKLENMNEWRGESKDRMATYATKDDLLSAMREIKTLVSGMKDVFVSKEEFIPVRSIVYGMVGITLLAVIGGILALVIVK